MVERSFSGAFLGSQAPIPPRLRRAVATATVTVLIARSGPAEKRFLLPPGAYVRLRSVASCHYAEVVAKRLAEDGLAPSTREALLALSSILAGLQSSGREGTCAVKRARRPR